MNVKKDKAAKLIVVKGPVEAGDDIVVTIQGEWTAIEIRAIDAAIKKTYRKHVLEQVKNAMKESNNG